MTDAMTDQKRIVVGVDGSDSARAALRWAMNHARVSGARVEAVIAWRHPTTYDWQPTGVPGDFAGAAKQTLAEEITALEDLEPGVAVVPLVAEGHPVEALLHASKGANLLVLGCRGRGGITSAVLGSVSLHCVLRAQCPVLVHREHPGES
jgi:nucleotide-binding universal stress UspA family protein